MINASAAVSLSRIIATAASKGSAKAHEGKTIVIVRSPNKADRKYG